MPKSESGAAEGLPQALADVLLKVSQNGTLNKAEVEEVRTVAFAAVASATSKGQLEAIESRTVKAMSGLRTEGKHELKMGWLPWGGEAGETNKSRGAFSKDLHAAVKQRAAELDRAARDANAAQSAAAAIGQGWGPKR
jgi:hypothetical protein